MVLFILFEINVNGFEEIRIALVAKCLSIFLHEAAFRQFRTDRRVRKLPLSQVERIL